MDVKVKRKQENSKMCFVCGLENSAGIKAAFYELENNELMAVFTPKNEHQGYEGRLHGGLAAAILDEAIGRAIMIHDPELWGVTIEFSMKLRKPVSLEKEVRVICRITQLDRRTFEGQGEVLTEEGKVAVEGRGKYLKMDLSKITDHEYMEDEWKVVAEAGDPESFSL